VTDSGLAATERTSGPGFSLVKVRSVSTSVFLGKPFVPGRWKTLRLLSSSKRPWPALSIARAAPWASRRKKSVASTRTRPAGLGLDREAPQHGRREGLLDRAHLVRVRAAGAEAGVALDEEQAPPDPPRETTWVPPSRPRSRPTGLLPRPEASDTW
jgi:hypothetical protein